MEQGLLVLSLRKEGMMSFVYPVLSVHLHLNHKEGHKTWNQKNRRANQGKW